jgi:hypothetical protein
VQDDPPFGALRFTVDEEQSVLLKLEVSKVGSPDGISPLILTNCALAFVHPLSSLLNRSRSKLHLWGTQFKRDGRWIPSIRTFQRLLIKYAINCCYRKCLWVLNAQQDFNSLTARIQRIRIGVSRDIRMTSDVPQGSHLGLLFFIWLSTEYR